MGIQVEFNPDLALRAFGTAGRLEEECIPENLGVGENYRFLKRGKREYWQEGEIPLRITRGNQQLSRPIASITIIEYTRFIMDGKIATRGIYRVHEVYDPNNPTIHFEGMEKIK